MSVPKGYTRNVAIIDLGKQESQIVPIERFWKDYDIDPRLWLGGDGRQTVSVTTNGSR